MLKSTKVRVVWLWEDVVVVVRVGFGKGKRFGGVFYLFSQGPLYLFLVRLQLWLLENL